MRSDIGYMDLKTIRTSPDYHQQIRKNIYAMIRQLGPPTFFISFSSAENHLHPLVNTLKQIRKRAKKSTEDEIENN